MADAKIVIDPNAPTFKAPEDAAIEKHKEFSQTANVKISVIPADALANTQPEEPK